MRQIQPKLLAALLMSMMLALCGIAMGEDGTAGEAETILLNVQGYEFTFQGPLTEGVIWQEIPETEEVDIRFCMPVRGVVNVPLFTMTVQQTDGDYAMTVQSPGDQEVPLAFRLAQRPEGLTDEEKWEFTWAQADVYVLMKTLTLLACPEEEALEPIREPFRVVTDDYEFSYDTRWVGKLCIYPENSSSLAFAAVIDGQLYTVFTLRYGADDGNFLIVLRDDDGKAVDVSFDMLAAPADMNAEERMCFYEVQGIVNEIKSTLILR